MSALLFFFRTDGLSEWCHRFLCLSIILHTENFAVTESSTEMVFAMYSLVCYDMVGSCCLKFYDYYFSSVNWYFYGKNKGKKKRVFDLLIINIVKCN